MHKNLQKFIEILKKSNQLITIDHFVDPVLEIAEITDRISKLPDGGKALLFTNNGTNFKVLTNAFGSEKRISLALNVNNIDELAQKINYFLDILAKPKNTLSDKISSLLKLKQLSSIIPKHVKKGDCQQIILNDPDLSILPILKTWPLDAARFVTLPLVNTIDPITNIRNVGMYRLQVFNKNTTGMHWHKHKAGAEHFSEYKKLNKKMPIAVVLGGDPVYTYVATAPLPDNIDEYMLAGFLRNEPVKLVKCITQDIEVPVDADFVIEGYVDPQEDFINEGPFGDHTGFYSEPDLYPRFHVTCITHKKDALYPATVVGIPPQEDFYFAKATQKIFLPLIQKTIGPEIIDFDLPASGVAHNYVVVKINNTYEGAAQKIMNSLWGSGQMAFSKFLFITDNSDLNIYNFKEFLINSLGQFDPTKDVFYSYGPMDVLEHASEKFTYGSKIGFDFTVKYHITKILKANETIDIEIFKDQIQNFINIKSLLNQQLPILLISLNKKEKIHFIAEKLIENIDTSNYKIIAFLDGKVDLEDLFSVSWLIGSNTAPARDIEVMTSSKFNNHVLIVDATSKNNKEIDNFHRQWPLIITSDKKIIQKIDEIWNDLKIGNFIESPSLKYLS